MNIVKIKTDNHIWIDILRLVRRVIVSIPSDEFSTCGARKGVSPFGLGAELNSIVILELENDPGDFSR